MAKKHQLSKEEIRKPDEISLFFVRAWEWLKRAYKPILMVGATILLGISVYATVNYYRNSRDERASRLLWAGYQNWLRPVGTGEEGEKPAPGERKPVKDRTELLQSTHDAYTRGIKSCGSSDVCALLHLVRGRVSYEMALAMPDQRDSRLSDALADMKKAAAVKGFLKVVAYDTKGHILEEMGKLDEAMEVYRQMATMASGSFSGQAMVHQARILEMQGKRNEAIALYQEIVKSKSTGWLAAEEAKLQQMIAAYQMMAMMPGKDGEDASARQMQVFQALNQARMTLIRLRESASVADPGEYAKVRLAFLDLGMDMQTTAAPAADEPAKAPEPAMSAPEPMAAEPAMDAPAADDGMAPAEPAVEPMAVEPAMDAPAAPAEPSGENASPTTSDMQ